jgi:IstB-like ATP binding protein
LARLDADSRLSDVANRTTRVGELSSHASVAFSRPTTGLGAKPPIGDPVVATAILDCLLHHSHVVTIRGDSYRLRERRPARPIKSTPPAKEAIACTGFAQADPQGTSGPPLRLTLAVAPRRASTRRGLTTIPISSSQASSSFESAPCSFELIPCSIVGKLLFPLAAASAARPDDDAASLACASGGAARMGRALGLIGGTAPAKFSAVFSCGLLRTLVQIENKTPPLRRGTNFERGSYN